MLQQNGILADECFHDPRSPEADHCFGDIAIAPIPLRANRSALLVSPQMQADESGPPSGPPGTIWQVLVGPSRHLRVRREGVAKTILGLNFLCVCDKVTILE